MDIKYLVSEHIRTEREKIILKLDLKKKKQTKKKQTNLQFRIAMSIINICSGYNDTENTNIHFLFMSMWVKLLEGKQKQTLLVMT